MFRSCILCLVVSLLILRRVKSVLFIVRFPMELGAVWYSSKCLLTLQLIASLLPCYLHLDEWLNLSYRCLTRFSTKRGTETSNQTLQLMRSSVVGLCEASQLRWRRRTSRLPWPHLYDESHLPLDELLIMYDAVQVSNESNFMATIQSRSSLLWVCV